jgi:hypothetical protein
VSLACGLTWPLPRYFQTHFLGDTSGDVGIYVWNLWIFRHELIEHGRLPVSTDHLFTYTDGFDFALHNYTPLAGLLGVPLMDWLGIVGTFNVILIASMALSAWGVFLLARRLGLAPLYAWSAGAVFIASPVFTARASEHFSLITAAPLPLFVWALLQALATKRFRHAALVGVLVAVATYSDAYYGIYCAMTGVFFVLWSFFRAARHEPRPPQPLLTRALNVCIATVALVMAWRGITGSTAIPVGNIRIGVQTLYTPAFVLTVLAMARIWLRWRPRFELHDPNGELRVLVVRGAFAIAVCLALLTPLIAGIGYRYFEDRMPETEVHWRSSAPGVDLLAYLVPNPVHPWFGGTTRSWFATDVGFPEFVASFSLVGLAVIATGGALGALPRGWVAFTGVFVVLSLGPFLHVAGLNTYVPGPWAVLRYVPIIGMARSPSRFTVLVMLGLSILFAFALREILRRAAALPTIAQLTRAGFGASRHSLGEGEKVGARAISGSVIAVALAMELIPAPRVLYSAEVPEVYKLITATDDEAGRVLELPTGVRDGIRSIGRINAAGQYFQTRHHRPIVGGYVSRVSRWRMRESGRAPVLGAILALSEGRTPPDNLVARARENRESFLRRTCVRFVIVDKRRASAELNSFALDVLNLKLVHEDAAYKLLTPIDPPPCAPRRRGRPWHFSRVTDHEDKR